MSTVYGCVGAASLIYYLIIWGYTGRRNSTFSIFWIGLGGVSFLLSVLILQLPEKVGCVLNYAVILMAVVFLMLEIRIVIAMYERTPENLDYLIILGAQVRGTKITNSLKRRLDCAQQYCAGKESVQIIVSGGQGRGEAIPEAQAMKIYLVQKGIASDRIFVEADSKTTEENLLFSKRLLPKKHVKVGIVTNNFHIYRAVQIGKRMGYTSVFAVPATSNPVLFVNYIVREGFGVLKMLLTKKER